MYWHLQTPTEHNMERVMRNLTAFSAFSASCFRAAASHSELLATKRGDCLGTDNWEHLQLAELINLYKRCYFMRCFSQPWLNSMPYWFSVLHSGNPGLSVTPAAIMPALVVASACSWESLTQKADWHYVNGFLSPSRKGVQQAEVRVQTRLPVSPSPGCTALVPFSHCWQPHSK